MSSGHYLYGLPSPGSPAKVIPGTESFVTEDRFGYFFTQPGNLFSSSVGGLLCWLMKEINLGDENYSKKKAATGGELLGEE